MLLTGGGQRHRGTVEELVSGIVLPGQQIGELSLREHLMKQGYHAPAQNASKFCIIIRKAPQNSRLEFLYGFRRLVFCREKAHVKGRGINLTGFILQISGSGNTGSLTPPPVRWPSTCWRRSTTPLLIFIRRAPLSRHPRDRPGHISKAPSHKGLLCPHP